MKHCPIRHVYDSAVGRRIYFIYGDVFDHEQDRRRHDGRGRASFFGNGNMTFFEHISLMIRARRAPSTPRGRDVYLANLDRFRIPITFITGEHNRMFVPQGLELTTSCCARPTGRAVHAARDPGLRAPGLLARARTPSATCSRSPSRSWSGTTDDGTARRPPTTRACRTCSATRSTPCLQDRRTRRVAQGVSLEAGAQPYESANEPSPLTPLEEAILIASTGPSPGR